MGDAKSPSHFIRELVLADNAAGKYQGRVATRFPPEPNGYLHIGHAKAIGLDFGLAREFGGTCNLRFDDTNPTTEDVEFVEAIQEDIRWLGYEWSSLHYASDYFEHCYAVAEKLCEKGAAYVNQHSEDEIRELRGDYYKKGRPCSCRDRAPAENLALLREMRAGKHQEGALVLRAKIDLSSQNMNLRDPVLYRIRYAPHHRTGTKWCIYPLYDYAHPLSDALEQITHSMCTLEFEAHRPLYDWCIRESGSFPSQQIEFARLNLTYTVMSKRKFIEMVDKRVVSGWDDPRMPTLTGLRRRGYTPEAIHDFCERIGVAKADSTVDVGLLEHCLREDLNRRAPRVMGVLKPLKLTIENFPAGEVRAIEAPLHPEDPALGARTVPFSRELWIERDDFLEAPPKEWFRLAPGREVRLRYACLVTCTEVVKDARGEVVELKCTWDPQSWGGTSPDGRAVRGTLHWVSRAHAKAAEVRLYDRLFTVENPGTTEGKSFLDELNPGSLARCDAWIEPALPELAAAGRLCGKPAIAQFERLGYFAVDPDTTAAKMVWNRAVTLKDTWAKIAKKAGGEKRPEAKPDKKPDKKAVEPPAEIGIDDFAKVDLRVAQVVEASLVEGADKLIRVVVDLGDGRPRQIFAGLRASYPDPGELVGRKIIVVANLKPRQMKFGLSEGMVLAAGHRVLAADERAQPGDRVS